MRIYFADRDLTPATLHEIEQQYKRSPESLRGLPSATARLSSLCEASVIYRRQADALTALTALRILFFSPSFLLSKKRDKQKSASRVSAVSPNYSL